MVASAPMDSVALRPTHLGVEEHQFAFEDDRAYLDWQDEWRIEDYA